MVVVALVDGVALEEVSVELVPLPGPPMAPLPVDVEDPVAPDVPLPAVPPLPVPGVVVPPLPPIALEPPVPLLPGVPLVLLDVDVSLLGAGVVVDELGDEVEGVAASSRLVQAASDTAATSASAAYEFRDALIRKLL